MPVALLILAIIALVLYILFNYVIPPPEPAPRYWRSVVSIIVIMIVLLLWYVIPIHIG